VYDSSIRALQNFSCSHPFAQRRFVAGRELAHLAGGLCNQMDDWILISCGQAGEYKNMETLPGRRNDFIEIVTYVRKRSCVPPAVVAMRTASMVPVAVADTRRYCRPRDRGEVHEITSIGALRHF
jgi:hypothetical protein